MTSDPSACVNNPHANVNAHVVKPRVLIGVFAALICLTGFTVAVTFVDLGQWNIWLALGIATAKACLVLLYFMHLRYEHPFLLLIVLTGVFFLLLFLGITLMDVSEYWPNVEAVRNTLA